MSPTIKTLLRAWIVAVACWLALPGSAHADTCNAAMTDVVFANVNPIASSDYYANGTLTVTCSWTLLTGIPPLLLFPNAAVCVTLGQTGSGGRAMSNGSAQLPFNLYTDTTYSAAAIWGGTPATPGSAAINSTLSGLLALGSISRSFPVYGKISAGSLGAVGTVGNASTAYSFSGIGTVQFAFFGLIPSACTAGSSSTFAFQAKTAVVNDCLINAGSLAFGTANVLKAPVRATAGMTIQCTSGSSYQITLNGGLYGSGPARKMKNTHTAETVNYRISGSYDGADVGDGSAGAAPLAGTGNGSVQTLTLYGRVSPQATPSPGDYTDTVTATLYF